MSGSEVNGKHVNQQEEMMEMLRSLVLRQGQREERMSNDRARGEGQSSPSNEQQDGVRTDGNLPASGVDVGNASRDEEVVDSVNVGPREFGSIKKV